MKQANPAMRFRLEQNHCTREAVVTASKSEQGLEAPEEFWVETDAYEEATGNKVSPDDIVYEEIDGV